MLLGVWCWEPGASCFAFLCFIFICWTWSNLWDDSPSRCIISFMMNDIEICAPQLEKKIIWILPNEICSMTSPYVSSYSIIISTIVFTRMVGRALLRRWCYSIFIIYLLHLFQNIGCISFLKSQTSLSLTTFV